MRLLAWRLQNGSFKSRVLIDFTKQKTMRFHDSLLICNLREFELVDIAMTLHFEVHFSQQTISALQFIDENSYHVYIFISLLSLY